jgi:hypothetical protein
MFTIMERRYFKRKEERVVYIQAIETKRGLSQT